MKKILFIFFIIIASIAKQGYAQTWVVIPDSIFVICLQNYVPAAMHHDSLNTSSPLVTTTTHSINVSSRNIKNLFGIQYFTSLTWLDCGGNLFATLPALPNSITYLDCSGSSSLTSITNIPTSLQTLNCENTSLTTLPALPTSLQTLNCYFSSFTSLPALPNSLLTLNCEVNSLTTLPALPNSLTFLWCNENQIDCFPPFPNSITDLSIDPNPYYCLPNYINAMTASDKALPLCMAGNSNNCPVAVAGISQISEVNTQISIYPNPNNGSFVIEIPSLTLPEGKGTLMQVYDVNGKVVLSQTINGKTTIDASSLNEGVYNVSISSSEGVINKRLVIVR